MCIYFSLDAGRPPSINIFDIYDLTKTVVVVVLRPIIYKYYLDKMWACRLMQIDQHTNKVLATLQITHTHSHNIILEDKHNNCDSIDLRSRKYYKHMHKNTYKFLVKCFCAKVFLLTGCLNQSFSGLNRGYCIAGSDTEGGLAIVFFSSGYV